MKRVPNLTLRVIGNETAARHLYRWNPGPALRAAGFKGADLWTGGPALAREEWRALGFDAPAADALRLKIGRAEPMGPAEAAKTAKALTLAAREGVARRRAGETPPTHAHAVISPARRLTLAALIADFMAAKEKTLPAKTLVNYRSHLAPVLKAWGDELPAVLTKDRLDDLHQALAARGPHAAYKTVKTLQTALIWAAGRDRWRGGAMPLPENYLRIGLRKPAARLRIATPDEGDALLLAFDDPLSAALCAPAADRKTAAALAGGLRPRRSMGDALVMMLWTAARVGDALSLTPANLVTRDGADWISYRQAKTGAGVVLPVVGALKQRLPDMLARRAIVAREHRAPLTDDLPLILSEETGAGYRSVRPSGVEDHRAFNNLWIAYRALAALSVPSLADFRPQDGRDTAVTRLLDAGGSLAEIASWHGSSVEAVIGLQKHYLRIDDRHAKSAGAALGEWAKREGVKV